MDPRGRPMPVSSRITSRIGTAYAAPSSRSTARSTSCSTSPRRRLSSGMAVSIYLALSRRGGKLSVGRYAAIEPAGGILMSAYDAVVIGGRVAGAPTAMLLARRGHNVLLVDRAAFPSDTISTHLIHPPGVTLLRSWGLLDALTATGCPAIHTYAFDIGPFVISGSPGSSESPVSY